MSIGAEIEGLMQKGEWDQARVLTEAKLQVLPANATLNAYLGLCLYRLNRFEDAIPPLKKACVLEPNNFDFALKLAQIYDRAMKYREAFAIAQEWIEKRPNDPTLQALHRALDRIIVQSNPWEKNEIRERQNVMMRDDG